MQSVKKRDTYYNSLMPRSTINKKSIAIITIRQCFSSVFTTKIVNRLQDSTVVMSILRQNPVLGVIIIEGESHDIW